VSPPRLLCIIGSGETTPTIAKLHRELFERAGDAPAVLLDTPYGFQSNAGDISARAVRYFRESAGRYVEVVALRRAEGASPLLIESAQARVAGAGWVFSGPGSPTYALRQWRPTSLPRLFADKLATGGCLVFSSAAALTLGRWTVPVYEIYKAGLDPSWDEGLDLLSLIGFDVAVIPHFDNAEGGTHDTRYCYLGEQRLELMERQLPPEGWVLGVDEHTACLFDFDEGTVRVAGLGVVTVRNHGREEKLAPGETVLQSDLLALASSLGPGTAGPASVASGMAGPRSLPPPRGGNHALPLRAPAQPRGPSLFLGEVERLGGSFDQALARRDPAGATEVALELESMLHEWSADTFQSDELARGRAALRRAVLRLGELAGPGVADRRELVSPWVEALLGEREAARRSRRFADADRIRDKLIDAGVEVRDTPEGTEWGLRGEPS